MTSHSSSSPTSASPSPSLPLSALLSHSDFLVGISTCSSFCRRVPPSVFFTYHRFRHRLLSTLSSQSPFSSSHPTPFRPSSRVWCDYSILLLASKVSEFHPNMEDFIRHSDGMSLWSTYHADDEVSGPSPSPSPSSSIHSHPVPTLPTDRLSTLRKLELSIIESLLFDLNGGEDAAAIQFWREIFSPSWEENTLGVSYERFEDLMVSVIHMGMHIPAHCRWKTPIFVTSILLVTADIIDKYLDEKKRNHSRSQENSIRKFVEKCIQNEDFPHMETIQFAANQLIYTLCHSQSHDIPSPFIKKISQIMDSPQVQRPLPLPPLSSLFSSSAFSCQFILQNIQIPPPSSSVPKGISLSEFLDVRPPLDFDNPFEEDYDDENNNNKNNQNQFDDDDMDGRNMERKKNSMSMSTSTNINEKDPNVNDEDEDGEFTIKRRPKRTKGEKQNVSIDIDNDSDGDGIISSSFPLPSKSSHHDHRGVGDDSMMEFGHLKKKREFEEQQRAMEMKKNQNQNQKEMK